MKNVIGRLLLLVLALVLATGAPARANGELGLSNDGVTWNGSLAPLFDASTRWVPGDARQSGFYARNQSTDGADLKVTLVPKVTDLYDTGQLRMQARLQGGDWTDLGTGWTSPEWLAAGESTRIDVRATLLPGALNETQTLAFDFDVAVRLTYADPDPTPSPTPTPSEPTTGSGSGTGTDTSPGVAHESTDDTASAPASDGFLPGTGADGPAWLLPAGAGALTIGLWLALAARRRTEDDEESELR